MENNTHQRSNHFTVTVQFCTINYRSKVGYVIVQVNVLQSPKLRKRFSLTSVPALRLFRDRRMFIYKGDWNAASISAFIKVIRRSGLNW